MRNPMAKRVSFNLDKIPTPGKIIGYVVAGGLAVYAVKALASAASSAVANQVVLDNEQQQYQTGGQVPSYSAADYRRFADSINAAVQGIPQVDDYGAVERILKMMKNSLDVSRLDEAYGTRGYTHFWGTKNARLFPTLTDEFGKDRKDRVNADWAGKGIEQRIG